MSLAKLHHNFNFVFRFVFLSLKIVSLLKMNFSKEKQIFFARALRVENALMMWAKKKTFSIGVEGKIKMSLGEL